MPFGATTSWTNYTTKSSFSITPGHGIWSGGYSRLFVHLSAYSVNASVGDVTVYISDLLWDITADTAGHETFSSQECNVTFHNGQQINPPVYGGSVMEVEYSREKQSNGYL